MTQPETNTTPETAPPAAPAGPPEAETRFVENFPEGKALANMTDAERATYWQNYARKHQSAAKALNNGVDPVEWASEIYKGLTPKQVADLQQKVEALESETMSATEKAVKEATKQARAEADAEYLPQIRAAKVQSIASTIVNGDKLNAFMEIVDPSKLLGDDGQVDETKVMGYLTAMYGASEPQGRQPQWQNFGQYAPPPPAQKPGAGGTAEAQKRFGAKT